MVRETRGVNRGRVSIREEFVRKYGLSGLGNVIGETRKPSFGSEEFVRKYGLSGPGNVIGETRKPSFGPEELARKYGLSGPGNVGGETTEHIPEGGEGTAEHIPEGGEGTAEHIPEGGEGSIGEISREVAAEVADLAGRLDRSLDEADATLEQILSDPDLPLEQRSQYEEIRDDIANCKSSSARVAAAPPDQLVADAATAVADVAGMTGSVDVLDAAVGSNSKWRSLWERFRRLLSEVPSLLWRMISRLVTVRQWTLAGEINSGMFPGGKASITITFG
jgi:hypothetical protein